jgi:ATP-dependent Clp protease protease subunit
MLLPAGHAREDVLSVDKKMRYIIKSDPRLQITKPYELLAAPEIVSFVGEITDESAAVFRRDLEVAEHNAVAAGQDILPVCIDSIGGCLYSLAGMIDSLKACNVTIATVVESKAMSAAAILATCGAKGHRYMGPLATIMIHSASGGLHGTLEEVEKDTMELKRLYDIFMEIMARNCSKKKNFFKDKIRVEGPEWYIDAEVAKDLGLIDHVGIPVLETNITYKHKLKLK